MIAPIVVRRRRPPAGGRQGVLSVSAPVGLERADAASPDTDEDTRIRSANHGRDAYEPSTPLIRPGGWRMTLDGPAAPVVEAPAAVLAARGPRSAGLAGIAFSVLFGASILALNIRPPEGLDEAGLVAWFETRALAATTAVALYLAPLAGIAFLWFIGVVRDRIGSHEDRLFATVFLGSGLLFIAMYWSGAAQLGSLVTSNRFDAAPPLDAETIEDVRSTAFSFLFVLAARAAAVFTIVTSTIIWRSGAMPRPIALIGYVIALAMLLSLSYLQWIVLCFPVWVFVVSTFLLVDERRRPVLVESVA
jgi:hypothetical protein